MLIKKLEKVINIRYNDYEKNTIKNGGNDYDE